MKLKLTNHFLDRLETRNISFEHVKQVLKDPDIIINTFGDKNLATRRIGEKTLEVVYRKNMSNKREEYILITAYYK